MASIFKFATNTRKASRHCPNYPEILQPKWAFRISENYPGNAMLLCYPGFSDSAEGVTQDLDWCLHDYCLSPWWRWLGVDQPDELVRTRADELTNHEGGEEVWGRQRHAVDNTSLRPFLTGSPWASGNSRTNNWALQRLFAIHPWNPLLPIHTHNVPQMPWSTSWGPGPGYVRARNWLLLRFIFPSKHWWAT